MVLLAVAFGAVIGLTLGALGGGGSILAVPALVYGLGQPVAAAVPMSLLVVGGGAAAGAVPHLRSGKLPWKSALVFGFAGIFGSYLGAKLNHALDERWLMAGFAALMFLAAAAMIFKKTTDVPAFAAKRCENAWRERPVALVAVGAIVGCLTGVFGVGGGFIIVPAWTLAIGCPARISVGASLMVIAINSAVAFVSHLGFGAIDIGITVAFTSAGITGAIVGGLFSERAESERLQRWFAYLVVGVAVFVLAQVFIFDKTI